MNININEIENLIFHSEETMYKLSQNTGIAQSTLSDIKTGKKPLTKLTLDQSIKIQIYLNNYKRAE